MTSIINRHHPSDKVSYEQKKLLFMIFVSIITPAYKCRNTIEETYKSVLAQTFSDWEWIVVDDCSPDDSFSYIKELTEGDPRVTVLQTPKNGGTAVARNIGLKHAKGRYITFLDSDDLLDPNYLECQLLFMKEHGPLISAGYRRKAKHTCTDFFVPDEVNYEKALKGNPLSCLTTMYDRSVIGDVFFLEDIDRPEDYVFWLNILRKGIIAYGNPVVLATYNIRDGSKSSNKFKLIGYMHKVYHKTQGINWLKSWFYVVRWAIYGKKKYRNVK